MNTVTAIAYFGAYPTSFMMTAAQNTTQVEKIIDSSMHAGSSLVIHHYFSD